MKNILNSEVLWQADTPFSEKFNDYYYNSDGGYQESLHVFVQPNQIEARYTEKHLSHLCINETGFGTGLNFYSTLSVLYQRCLVSAEHPLHFFSSERFPLNVEDFIKASAQFPQFKSITDQLVLQYPPAIQGFHRIILNGGEVYLTLMFADSLDAYQQCTHRADIWYLDGFSPAKNPEMWQPELFSQVARLSHPDRSTLSTFTSAGFVRRGLKEVGFEIKKQSGFGQKREMSKGVFLAHKTKVKRSEQPWFNMSRTSQDNIKKIAVIGAGLAGCTTAEALARRGFSVTLFDQENQICAQASGNLQGALYAKLPSKPTTSGQFHLTGLEYSLRQLHIHQCFNNKIAQQCGLIQLAVSDKDRAQQAELLNNNLYSPKVVRYVSAKQASEIANTHTPHSGLFFPRAGWVAPKQFCQKIIDNSKITLFLNTQIKALQPATQISGWELYTADNKLHFDAVVIASAAEAKNLTQCSSLPIKAIRGQVTHSPKTGDDDLATVVCGAGYISPAIDDTYCFGASFNLHTQELDLQHRDQQTNIKNLASVLPTLLDTSQLEGKLTGKVAYRCTSPDYLPLVGPVPIEDQIKEKYGRLRSDKNWQFEETSPSNYKDLYLNIGHGSKGLITCPLSAEHIACMINNEPSPLPSDLSQAIHPVRFIVKQLIRRAI